jgi:hypothetical protein
VKLAAITTKSKTFQPLLKKSRCRRPYAPIRIASSTTKSPRITSFARFSAEPISSSTAG